MSSNREKIDLLEAYFVNNRNAGAALVWYRNKYPLRHVPTRKVIRNLLKNLELQGSFKRKRQPRVDMDTEIAVLTYVEAYPEVSSRHVAFEVGVSHSLVIKIWKKYGYKCYRSGRIVQVLHPGDDVRRLTFCRWLRGKISRDHEFLNYILWSDETNFSNNGMYNRKNHHYWAKENPLRVTASHNQVRFSFNCWCGIMSNRVIMVEFYEGKLNSAMYNEVILHHLENEMDEWPLSELRKVHFQQDGAPPHNSHLSRSNLSRLFGTQWIGTHGPTQWPPRSPDLTPLDFFLWGFVKNEVYKTTYASVQELKDALMTILRNIHPRTLLAAIRSVQKRIDLCIRENGNHFEQFIS